MKRTSYIMMLAAALIVLALDQISKLWVSGSMQLGGLLSLVDGFARLRYTQNRGSAFGLFQDATGLLSIFSLLVIIGILVAFVRMGQPTRLMVLAAGLVVGGALGNLVDRVRLGYVVDFVEVYGPRLELNHTVYTWPVFNVADSGITIGVILILAGLLFGGDKIEEPARKETEAPHERRINMGNSAWRVSSTNVGMESSAGIKPTPAGWVGMLLVMLGFLIMALRSVGKTEER